MTCALPSAPVVAVAAPPLIVALADGPTVLVPAPLPSKDVDAEVNPALAAHGGYVTFVGHDGEGHAYLTMGGGCHGCSMSRMTMLQGVQTMIADAVPGIEKVIDATDHSTGENPFYT